MINTTMPPISVQSGPAAAASAASHAPSTQLSPVPQSASSVHSASGAISTHSPAEHSFPVPHSVPSATATLLTVPVVSSQESAVHGFESSESMPSHKLTSVSCRSATTGALYEAIAFESICFCTLYVTVVVAPGATTTVTYKVQKQIDSNAIASYKAPVVADLQETEVSLCDGIDSDDSNPCTADSCDETTGTVSNVAVADGTECGTGKECSAGECVEIAPEAECTEDADCGTGESCVDGACEAAEAAAAGPDWTLIGGIVVLIIIIAGAAYYFLIMRRR